MNRRGKRMIYSADWTHDPQLFVHAQANKNGKMFPSFYKGKWQHSIFSLAAEIIASPIFFPSQLSVTEGKKKKRNPSGNNSRWPANLTDEAECQPHIDIHSAVLLLLLDVSISVSIDK